jgi:hypothetical protein
MVINPVSTSPKAMASRPVPDRIADALDAMKAQLALARLSCQPRPFRHLLSTIQRR